MIKYPTKQQLFVVFCLVFAAIQWARITGSFTFFRIWSENMVPNYAPRSFIFSSNWIQPKRQQVVTYYDTCLAIPNIRLKKRELYIGRIMGIGGDTFAISKGRVFINGKPMDTDQKLAYFWQLSDRDYQANRLMFGAALRPPVDFADSVLVLMEKTKALEVGLKVPLKCFDIRIAYTDQANVWGETGKKWTLNEFGPVRIPKGSVFILGDNRHDTEDSRHRGFVPEKDITGTIIL